LAEGLTQTITGKFGFTTGLVWAILQVSLLMLSWRIKIKPRVKSQSFNWSDIKQVAVDYRNFPIQNGIPSFLNALSLLLPVILLIGYSMNKQPAFSI
jgi:hypothetical protein